MLEKLKSIAIFAAVVDERSFRGAARKLAVSPAVVSLHIKKLEEQIGAPLLYRSTRRIRLTQDGKAFYPAAKAMISAANDGLGQFASQANIHLTELRVAMPDTLSTNPIIERIADFIKNHAGIRLNLMSTDHQQSLINEGHDVAIRMGHFKDSDLKSKRIGEDERILVCSPKYFNDKANPHTPEDISTWDFVSFSLVPDYMVLHKGELVSDNIWGTVIAKGSSAQSVRALCASGLGLAALPYHLVKKDLDTKRLVRVLPDWDDPKKLPIYLVWISNADLSLATREFINFMSRK